MRSLVVVGCRHLVWILLCCGCSGDAGTSDPAAGESPAVPQSAKSAGTGAGSKSTPALPTQAVKAL